jgi:hypothetical protein
MKTSPEMIGVGTVTGEGLCCPAQVEHKKPTRIRLENFLWECGAQIMLRMITDLALKLCAKRTYPVLWVGHLHGEGKMAFAGRTDVA